MEKGFEIGEVAVQNGFEDGTLEFLITVDGDVAESDHVLHGLGGGRTDRTVSEQEPERVAAGLGDPEPIPGHPMHGQINAGLTGPQEVEHDRVLNREIIKTGFVPAVIFTDPGKAAADHRRFIEQHVVHHDSKAVRTG